MVLLIEKYGTYEYRPAVMKSPPQASTQVVAARLRLTREALGLSQADLARALKAA